MELDKTMIEGIIREVIRDELANNQNAGGGQLKRHIDSSGVIGIDPKGLKLEKFPFPIESDRVWLLDVMDLDESPRLGCGIMELDRTEFEWTLTYDEIDYIIEGTLDILIDGRRVRATEGQILFIPKNTKIKFSTPDKTRFMYVCYPANWSEQ